MLLGAADDAAPAEYCQELAKQLPPDYPIKVHIYPDARHSFDRDDLPAYQRRRARRGSVGYNAKAAAQAWEEVRKFFATHLGGSAHIEKIRDCSLRHAKSLFDRLISYFPTHQFARVLTPLPLGIKINAIYASLGEEVAHVAHGGSS